MESYSTHLLVAGLYGSPRYRWLIKKRTFIFWKMSHDRVRAYVYIRRTYFDISTTDIYRVCNMLLAAYIWPTSFWTVILWHHIWDQPNKCPCTISWKGVRCGHFLCFLQGTPLLFFSRVGTRRHVWIWGGKLAGK